MTYQGLDEAGTRGPARAPERKPYELGDRFEFEAPEHGNRLTRWAAKHWLVTALAVAAAWLITLGLAFEAGHAYAEGVRSIGGFVDHLGEMYEHYLGSTRTLAGWLWLSGFKWV